MIEMKGRKESLLKELEKISLDLVDIQYQLKPAKRKPVPTIPIIYIDEQTKDPFEVLLSDLCIRLAYPVLSFIYQIDANEVGLIKTALRQDESQNFLAGDRYFRVLDSQSTHLVPDQTICI